MNFKKKLNAKTIGIIQNYIKPYLSAKEFQQVERALMQHNTSLLNHDKKQRDLEQMSWLNTQKIKNSLNPNT